MVSIASDAIAMNDFFMIIKFNFTPTLFTCVQKIHVSIAHSKSKIIMDFKLIDKLIVYILHIAQI